MIENANHIETDSEPSMDPEADYFWDDPEKIRRVRGMFLEAIRARAPEVLNSLHDLLVGIEKRGSNRSFEHALFFWAEDHHLYNGACPTAGDWLVAAARVTLADWRRDPARRETLQWSPIARSQSIPSAGLSSFHRIYKGGLINEPFRFEHPPWEPADLSLDEYKSRLMRAFKDQLDATLDLLAGSTRDRGMRPAPPKVAEHHFDWLVDYQVRGRSKRRIAAENGKDRQTVDEAIDETAKLLIGPYWHYWLRPPPRGGRPRRSQGKRT